MAPPTLNLARLVVGAVCALFAAMYLPSQFCGRDAERWFHGDAELQLGLAESLIRSIISADLNGDGNQDLASANFSTNDLSILFGNGDGTFLVAQSIAVRNGIGVGPRRALVGDFDADGSLDLIADLSINYELPLVRGNGDGTFQPAESVIASRIAFALAVSDIDGDGILDLVGNDISDAMVLLLGRGDGTFEEAQGFASGGSSANDVAVADLNGDGKADIASANINSASVSVQLQR